MTVTRRLLIGIALAIGLIGFSLWLLYPKHDYEKVYVRGRNVTAWNRLAQVREPVVNLRYGEVVSVVERQRGNVFIETPNGNRGWVDERQLMPAELWQQSEELLRRARRLPAYASGKTKVVSNLRAEPGRATQRIYQLPTGVPVEVVARAVADWAPEAESPRRDAGRTDEEATKQGPRREDWYLVRTKQAEVGEVAGWALGRFIEPDPPDPLRQLGAGIRWMGWYELDRITDVSGEKGQFLGLGALGPQGQACDFTLLRVYTWHLGRHRYETAYVESNLCGHLPVKVIRPGQETVFTFQNVGARGQEQREYRFRQNVVRRVRAPAR